ncbi:MAG: KOW motif-containing protein [Candidatus Shikimatogenerans sp. JK-2022]|nr:KOW motif-containing protein [Candidatus Shikimatogenerans bostrichidophilus]
MFKFQKFDNIIVISGKYKGKKGIIKKINRKKKKVILNLFNPIEKKENLLLKEVKINISNISILDKKYKKRTRIGFKIINGEKKRIYKKSKLIIKKKDVYS